MSSIYKRSIKLSAVVIVASALFALPGCTNLDVVSDSQYTDDNFLQTPAQFISYMGPVYTAAQRSNPYQELQSPSSDELIIPTRGEHWGDGGQWKALHTHDWSAANGKIASAWKWGFESITTCNRVIQGLANAPEDMRERSIAEVKTMRAWYYFLMMDLFGNIPLYTVYDPGQPLKGTSPRADVFAFIVKDLEENIDKLSDEKSANTYGRPTQYMAHTLLAKLYLNSEVYAGIPQWEKVIAHCTAVEESGKYDLVPASEYFAMFSPTNGPQHIEPIFSIPYDAIQAEGNNWTGRAFHYRHQITLGLNYGPWNGWATPPAIFNSFEKGKDIRFNMFIHGPQMDKNGNVPDVDGLPFIIDPYYFPGTKYSTVTPDPIDPYNVGNGLGQFAGARNNKYGYDATSNGSNANNDLHIFRYADVLLMKAEALLRLGQAPEGRGYVNQIRRRAGVDDFPTLNEQNLYEERGRELCGEFSRRTDQIRFGRFEDPGLYKPSTAGKTYQQIFPVPNKQRELNPNLKQNPGYN